MLWLAAIALCLMFSAMVRMIFVMVRERENYFKLQAALEQAIYEAGWIEGYGRARNAADRKHASFFHPFIRQ